MIIFRRVLLIVCTALAVLFSSCSGHIPNAGDGCKICPRFSYGFYVSEQEMASVLHYYNKPEHKEKRSASQYLTSGEYSLSGHTFYLFECTRINCDKNSIGQSRVPYALSKSDINNDGVVDLPWLR